MMLTWDDVQYILRTVLRWWWVVVIAVGISAGTTFYLTQNQPDSYYARATLQIGNAFDSTLPDRNQLELSASLGQFYQELARREPILAPVREQLQIQAPWQYISDRMLQTNVVPNAGLLEIAIVDTNPERAAALSNAIGEQLMAYSPTSPEKIEDQQQEIQRQIDASLAKSAELEVQIAEMQRKVDEATSAADRREFREQLDELETSFNDEQSTYRTLLSLLNNSAVNSIDFLARAIPPSEALPSKRRIALGSAGLAGMMLALLAIFVLERLDNRWKGQRDLTDRFGLDDLGFVPIGPPILLADSEFAQNRERAIRNVHTNVLLAAAGGGSRSFIISSPHPSEDRACLTIDLAYLFARSGHKVLVVDADLSNPLLTRTLLPHSGPLDWSQLAQDTQSEIWVHLRPTAIPNVMLLPGKIADDHGLPALVPSLHWPDLVKQLLNAADIVLFDGPAALDSADAALLSPLVDGVLLALDPKHNMRDSVDRSKARLLHQKGARLLGAVTFTPSGQASGLRGFWKQLGVEQYPALPAAGSTHVGASGFVGPRDPASVIVTPPPEHVQSPANGYPVDFDGKHTNPSGMVASVRSAARTPSEKHSSLRRRRRLRSNIDYEDAE